MDSFFNEDFLMVMEKNRQINLRRKTLTDKESQRTMIGNKKLGKEQK